MTLPNADIRERAKAAGVLLWQIADELHVNDGNLSRKLRHELSGEDKAQIFAIIERLRGANA